MDTPTINSILNGAAILLSGLAAWFSQRNHKKLNSGSTIMITSAPTIVAAPAQAVAVQAATVVVDGITYKRV